MQDLRGRLVKGYELLEMINLGGFGAVYRAHQTLIDREVAFKIILPQYASQPDFIRRFEAEAQLVARLEHLHIVPLYDYWRDPDGAYLVMRWLRGGSLRAALARRGYFDAATVANLLDQIAAGLAVAHRQGVVHRDIKPDNILLDEDNNAYLADFGIAIKLIDLSQLDQKELRLGSPPYTPPEQILGQTITPQTDIYSLGIVLFELLTGRVPFTGPNDTEIMRLHLSDPVPPLQQWRPDLPENLNHVIWRATAKAFRARYASTLELALDFRQSLELADKRVLVQAIDPASMPDMATGELHTVNLSELPTPVNPYKGLRAFQEADEADFYGREKLVERLVEIFKRGGEDSRFLAIVGPSGSGKSSVVNAGFIPALRAGAVPGSNYWFYGMMTPGAQPYRALQDALLRSAAQSPPDLEAQLRSGDDGLHQALRQILPDDDSDLLLVIDQFEEVFTLAGEVERRQFLTALETAIQHADSRLRLIVTLRADFYDRPLLHPGFGELMRTHTEVILPLTASELAQAIRAPAERVGLYVEQELIAAIVVDVNKEPGALPLLQYTLTELFENGAGNNLTLAAYQSVGGISGALARRADEIYTGLDRVGQELAHQMFMRLVKIGENQETTRRRTLQTDVLALGADRMAMAKVMEAFARYRLLTFDHEPTMRAPTVELAHEALIREWKQLAAWIEISRDDLRTEQRLAAATNEWLKAQRDPSFLAGGARLAQFETLAQSQIVTLNADEMTYVRNSTAARQRATNRARLVLVALVLFSMVALALAGFALAERDRADAQARTSGSRALAVTALTNREQLDLSLLLSLEALKTADTFEARNSLLTALQFRPHLSRFLHGHEASARAVAYSPDGKLAASGSWDNTVIVWDVQGGQPAFPPLTGHTGDVNAVTFSPDSRWLASGGKDGTIRLWDMATGETTRQPIQTDAAVWSLAFDSAGDRLAAGRADGLIDVWNPATGQRQRDSIPAHEDAIVYSVAFDATGQRLASGGADNRARLWDAATGEAIGVMPPEHMNWVMSVALSPDGQLLASGGADRLIVLWDAASGQIVNRIVTDHSDWVTSLAFDPTGTLLASGSSDRLIKLWDVVTGQPAEAPLVGHADKVWSVAFSPDGLQLLSGADDGGVLLWDVSPTYRVLGTALDGYSEAISSVAFSPDGALLATTDGDPAGRDNAIRLWETRSGRLTGVLKGHVGPVQEVAFSPDGQTLASASADQTVRLWSVADQTPLGEPFIGHSNVVFGVAFSPDGRTVVSASDDGSIILWDAATGMSLGVPLKGHTTGVLTVAFSPDGTLLASGGRDNSVRLWAVPTHQMIGEPLTGHTDAVERVTFSPDGRQLASASRDTTIILWDVTTRQPAVPPLAAHTQPVLDAAFSPDGQLLVSGGRDNQVLLWDAAAARLLGTAFDGHTDWVNGVAFSPDGQAVVSGGDDRTLIRWDVGLSSWQARACFLANRALTGVEITNYLGSIPYQTICGGSAVP